MQKILTASLIYRAVAALARFFSAQWQDSRLIARFLRGSGNRAYRGSVFTAALTAARRAEVRVFHALRLDKRLQGSIFLKPEAWCALTLLLAPLVPTMAAAGLVFATLLSLFLTLGADPERRAPAHPANKYILLYIFVSAAAVFTSVTVRGSLEGGAMLALFALFSILVQYAVNTRRRAEWVVRALVCGGFFVACLGGLQFLRGTSNASAWLDSNMFEGMVRVYSTLENPNVLAEYLLLVLPFAAAVVIVEKKRLPRLAGIAALGAMLVCMLLTYSRGGWLGLVLAAAVFLVMLDRRFILAGIVGLAALYFILPESILERFLSIGNTQDGSTSYRVYIWLGTLAMLRDYWFVGIGPGTAAFNKVYPLYGYNAVAAPHSHNLLLQIVCDAGIMALVFFVFLAASLFRSLAVSVKDGARAAEPMDKRFRVYRIAAISALVGFLAQGMTDYSFYNYRVALVFWGFVGLAAVFSRREDTGAETKRETRA